MLSQILKKRLDKALHKTLWGLTEAFPSRTRDIKVYGNLYLRRFYLTPCKKDEKGELTDRLGGYGIYLHYFYKGDEDRELHNHPWKDAFSIVLTGGYMEERRDEKTFKIVTSDIRPGNFNKIGSDVFHRVTKKEGVEHIWTLFFCGKRTQDWGFWNRETDEYVSHKDFDNKFTKPKVKKPTQLNEKKDVLKSQYCIVLKDKKPTQEYVAVLEQNGFLVTKRLYKTVFGILAEESNLDNIKQLDFVECITPNAEKTLIF